MSRSNEKPVVVEDGVSYHSVRGKIYRIEELTAGDYEKLQRQAEIPNPKDENEKVTDLLLLTKLVTLDSVTIVEKDGDPAGAKLDPAAWAKEKYPVTSRIALEVRRAHYMALTDKEIADEKAELAKQGKEKADPND